MAYRALAEFLEALADQGGLKLITAEVDPRGELAQIARSAALDGGPALVFQKVRGCPLPVVANLLASEARAARVLGVDTLAQLAERSEAALRAAGAAGWLARLKGASEPAASQRFRPKTVRSAPCQQVVRRGRDIDLAQLAVLRHGEAESHSWMSAAQMVSADDSGARRLTPCRLLLVEGTKLAIVDDGPGDWSRAAAAARERGEKLAVAVFLGGDPSYQLAAAVPGCEALDAYVWLGLVRDAVVETVKCKTSALEVPADAEIVIEGVLDPADGSQRVTVGAAAGPYYRAALDAPVLQVEAVTQRTNCLLPACLGTEAETAVARKVAERLLLPAVRAAIPELVDYALPSWGGGDRFAFVSIRKTTPLQAHRAASALWGLPAFQAIKFLVVVDEEVDVQQSAQVWDRVGANVDPSRDTFVRPGPAAPADHAFAVPLIGSQLGIDATRKLPGEAPTAGPAELDAGQQIRELVARRWKEYGF